MKALCKRKLLRACSYMAHSAEILLPLKNIHKNKLHSYEKQVSSINHMYQKLLKQDLPRMARIDLNVS